MGTPIFNPTGHLNQSPLAPRSVTRAQAVEIQQRLFAKYGKDGSLWLNAIPALRLGGYSYPRGHAFSYEPNQDKTAKSFDWTVGFSSSSPKISENGIVDASCFEQYFNKVEKKVPTGSGSYEMKTVNERVMTGEIYFPKAIENILRDLVCNARDETGKYMFRDETGKVLATSANISFSKGFSRNETDYVLVVDYTIYRHGNYIRSLGEKESTGSIVISCSKNCDNDAMAVYNFMRTIGFRNTHVSLFMKGKQGEPNHLRDKLAKAKDAVEKQGAEIATAKSLLEKTANELEQTRAETAEAKVTAQEELKRTIAERGKVISEREATVRDLEARLYAAAQRTKNAEDGLSKLKTYTNALKMEIGAGLKKFWKSDIKDAVEKALKAFDEKRSQAGV